jgi:hypothetical protein
MRGRSMTQNSKYAGNVVILRGACLWIGMAPLLAWSLVGLYNNIYLLKTIFPRSPRPVLQAHLDFLIMSALILGFYAAKVSLPLYVGCTMSTSPNAELAKAALSHAIRRQQPDTAKLMFHSDQAVPYSAKLFINYLNILKLSQSMSRRGCVGIIV